MKISIWDMDFYESRKGFNTDCMKISSFHKQKHDTVNFILRPEDINRPYDIIYIHKESCKIKSPPMRFFDKRARVWGSGFKYLSSWKIPDVMLACRPDYLLYPDRKSQFERADMAQFFNDNGELLPLTQDYKNTFSNKKTLVIDRAFWKASQKNILFAINSLKDALNIAFLEPISLKKVVCDKLIRDNFLQLDFTEGSNFQFINDVGDTREDAALIADFLEELKERAPTTVLGVVNFEPITKDHYAASENAWYDLERCLQIINYAKEKGLIFKIKPLSERLKTPYFVLFETLSSWTEKGYKWSLLEYIAMPTAKRFKCTIEEVYQDSMKWHDPVMCNVMTTIYRRKSWISAYCLRRWKKNTLEITKIDWQNIEENKLW